MESHLSNSCSHLAHPNLAGSRWTPWKPREKTYGAMSEHRQEIWEICGNMVMISRNSGKYTIYYIYRYRYTCLNSMFNGNCEKLWLNMIDHRICGCQLFSDKLIYVYINNPSQDIYINRFSTANLAWEDSPTNNLDVSHYIPSVTNNMSQCSKPEMTSLEKLLSWYWIRSSWKCHPL